MNLKKFIEQRTPAQKIAFSFLITIFIGAILLSLPMSTKNNQFFPFVDALFIATSCTCVTGLTTVVVSETFNLFGQFVMMVLIQIGGLGFLTLMAFVISKTRNKFRLKEKDTMKEMLNQDKVIDMKVFIQDIMKYTFLFELIGAILIAFTMVPEFGWIDGIFKSIFLAVSAFCNAGFDTLGQVSLQNYIDQPFFMIIIMLLIILGGLGFALWFDVRDQLKRWFKKEITFKKLKKSLSFHTKVVLFMTLFLIFIPAFIMLLLEWNNVDTIASFNVPQKILAMLFESVALRTAGFASIAYSGLQVSTSIIMILLMFIGGSPGGTAGGIKTTTMLIIMMHIISTLRQNEKVVLWKKTISKDVIVKAMGIFYLNIMVYFVGIFALSLVESFDFIAICFEVMSALATVGSTLGITSELSITGKLIISLIMYIGRIGIVTLLVSLLKKNQKQDLITYPQGNIIV